MTSGVPWQIDGVRQRARDTAQESARRSGHPGVLPRATTQGLSSLEQQLRQITAHVEMLRPCRVEDAIETLRDDLAEISLAVKEALPRQAIEGLENEVRGLAERLLGNRREIGAESSAAIERGLAEI